LSQRKKSPPKETILFISHDASRTGAPILLLNILRWLRTHIPNPFKILLRQGGPLEPHFREIGDVVIAADSDIANSYLHDVCLIYSNTITNGCFLETLPYGNIPIVTHVHEMNYVIGLHGSDNIHEVKKHTGHFISCSKAAAAALMRNQGIDPARITVIPGSVSPSDILVKSKTEDPLRIRKSLGIDAKAMVILGCGTRDLRKGIDLYIQLAAYCARNRPTGKKLEFLWIGSEAPDPVADMFQTDARKLGRSTRLRFLGELENPYPYIAASDLFCLPSREDPLPLVMLEAGALNKPTLAFKGSGGAEEYCRQGGGFLIPYLDVAGMGDWILNRPVDRTPVPVAGRRAAKLIQKKYTMDVNGPQYLRMIQNFIRQDASAGSAISQLFIPDASGYTEEASVRKQVTATGWDRVHYDFRAQGPNNARTLRIDPLDRAGVVEISMIVLSSAKGRKIWKAQTPDAFDKIRVDGSAVRLPDTKVLKLLSLGSDPILYLPELPADEGEEDLRLELVLRTDTSPETVASHLPSLLQVYRKSAGLCRDAEQTRTQLSVATDQIQKLRMELLLAGTSVKGREIYVWGTGAAGRRLGRAILRRGHEFRGFVDPDPKKEGRKTLKHTIFAPAILTRKGGTKPFIIIGSQFHPQISRRLTKMGLVKGEDFEPSPFL